MFGSIFKLLENPLHFEIEFRFEKKLQSWKNHCFFLDCILIQISTNLRINFYKQKNTRLSSAKISKFKVRFKVMPVCPCQSGRDPPWGPQPHTRRGLAAAGSSPLPVQGSVILRTGLVLNTALLSVFFFVPERNFSFGDPENRRLLRIAGDPENRRKFLG